MSLKTATESTPNELYEYLKKSGVKKVEECVWPSLAKEEVTTLNDLNQLTEQDILDIAKQHGLAIMIRRQLLTAKTNLSTQMSATNWDGNTQFERSDNSTPIKKRQEMNSNDKKATYQSISYESASILSNSVTNEQVSLSIANGIGQSQHRVRATTKVNTKNSKPKPYPCPNAMIAARNANGDNINNANNNGNSNNEELSVMEEKKQQVLNDNVNIGFDIDIDSKHTRTSTKRPIIIAHFDTKKTNSILEYHNSIMCIYFTRWEHGNNNNTLITRVFKIDLIIDASKEKKIRLRIVGPLTKINMGMFKCIKYIELENMSLNDLFDIAKQTMNGFKEYNRYLHNCWHFCESFIKMAKLASETAQENDENMEHQLDTMSDISSVIGDSLNANNLNNLNNHHLNNGNEKIGITINDKESKCNKLQAYVTEFFYCCNKNGNNNNNNNNKNGLFIPIGFDQVSNEFELSEKIDENIIITGYLCKESRALYKWRQRYCVLKTDNILYTYKPKDLKLKHATETISITNAKIKYEKEEQSHDKTEFAPTSSYTIDPNCRFTIITQLHSQTFHFVAQSKQKRQHWIQMIEKYANVRPTGYQQIDTLHQR